MRTTQQLSLDLLLPEITPWALMVKRRRTQRITKKAKTKGRKKLGGGMVPKGSYCHFAQTDGVAISLCFHKPTDTHHLSDNELVAAHWERVEQVKKEDWLRDTVMEDWEGQHGEYEGSPSKKAGSSSKRAQKGEGASRKTQKTVTAAGPSSSKAGTSRARDEGWAVWNWDDSQDSEQAALVPVVAAGVCIGLRMGEQKLHQAHAHTHPALSETPADASGTRIHLLGI